MNKPLANMIVDKAFRVLAQFGARRPAFDADIQWSELARRAGDAHNQLANLRTMMIRAGNAWEMVRLGAERAEGIFSELDDALRTIFSAAKA